MVAISLALFTIFMRDLLYYCMVGHSRFSQYREEMLNWSNFRRPSFRAWSDGGKIHIESGDDRDHATRCVDYFRQKDSRSDLFTSILEYATLSVMLPTCVLTVLFALLFH